ncbi:MAG: DHHA1 domain-containing protein [Nitrososphaeria archaeon]
MHIITHGDCDGICAGALAFSVHHGSRVVFSNPVRLYDSLQKIDGSESIFICDIALNDTLFQKVNEAFKNFESTITYVDHHPLSSKVRLELSSNVKLVHSLKNSASELAFYHLRESIDPEMGRVAIYGAIGDYLDTTEGVQLILENWDKRTLYFQTGILIQALEAIGRNDGKKLEILDELSKNILPSEIDSLTRLAVESAQKEEYTRKYVKKNAEKLGGIGYILDPDGPLGKAAIYARAYTGARVGLAGEVKRGKVEMSLRTNIEIDLNSILTEVAPKFGGVGGGHAKAAGAEIPFERFRDFLQALDNQISINLNHWR